MTGNEIRKKFLQYFADHGHTVVASSSLVPHDDPTLLFTNAGMVQFKKVFTGEEKREYVRAVTAQRCVRAGGKHNDLDNVGYTARHHTFFEMLGNFSFGDYFKADAIRYAWDFLTGVIGLPKDKLWVSVFKEDDEAYALWEKIEGLPKGRIIRLGEKDNFWAMGDTGPCGPCSEILIDQGPAVGCGGKDCRPGCDCDRYLELWNLVFMQLYRDEAGKLTPLPKPSIDTGMGLERIAAVAQGKFSNYDSDLFAGIIGRIYSLAGVEYGRDRRLDTALRVIADHSRATTFLVADGVLPSNEGRGYVLRRIMRRAIRYGRILGFTQPFLAEITATVVDQMRDAYPHLPGAASLLGKVVRNEEERFLETLDHGLAMLSTEIGTLKSGGGSIIGGDFIFKLYDTYGLPVDIVRDVALEEGLAIDEAGFHAAMEVQRQQSKKSWKGAASGQMKGLVQLAAKDLRSTFVGYDTRRAHARITGILDAAGEESERLAAGEQGYIVCEKTPFYAEAGGQAGDQGEMATAEGRATVTGTIGGGDGIILHRVEVREGSLSVGHEADLKVAESRRQRVANNHTATHLLQAALKEVLGDHVKQSGSLVEPDRLRFDFTHFQPVTLKELQRVEQIVNDEIRANTAMTTENLTREKAMQSGATALFGEKYGETVRVVSIGAFSKELCGGTHVGATGEIGLFKVVNETGIAAGIRRIEAITGQDALARFQETEKTVLDLAGLLKIAPSEIMNKVEKLLAGQKKLEKEISQLTAKMSLGDLDSIINNAREIAGIRVIATVLPVDSAKTMRDIGDKVREKMGSGVAVLGGTFDDKVTLLALVSKDLTNRLHAGNIVKEIAEKVGGSGGGRPDMAQAGGTMVDKLPGVLAEVPDIVAAKLQ